MVAMTSNDPTEKVEQDFNSLKNFASVQRLQRSSHLFALWAKLQTNFKQMKVLCLSLILIAFTHFDVVAQTAFDFTLDESQSMLMTGKGPGQDATINPYDGQDCFALVTNRGRRSFSVRIQQNGQIMEEILVGKRETKKIVLLKGYELYLDPNPKGYARARVSYAPMKE